MTLTLTAILEPCVTPGTYAPQIPMFPSTYVPRSPCSLLRSSLSFPESMFPDPHVLWYIHSNVFPGFLCFRTPMLMFLSTYVCSWIPMFLSMFSGSPLYPLHPSPCFPEHIFYLHPCGPRYTNSHVSYKLSSPDPHVSQYTHANVSQYLCSPDLYVPLYTHHHVSKNLRSPAYNPHVSQCLCSLFSHVPQYKNPHASQSLRSREPHVFQYQHSPVPRFTVHPSLRFLSTYILWYTHLCFPVTRSSCSPVQCLHFNSMFSFVLKDI